MNCCQCQGIESTFNEQMAARELKTYRKKGASKQTRLLIDSIKTAGVEGLTLLDIGGGVGAVQYGLLEAGVARASDVDASSSYLKAAREESARRGYSERIEHQHGDFVDLAEHLPSADIVTLDRVICCYHDMQALVSLSSGKAQRYYGVVYPIDAWWSRLGMAAGNVFMKLSGNPFRIFIHPSQAVEALVNANGFQRVFYRAVGFWQVIVYARA